ncbi:MAG: cell division protein ZapA [Bacteroidetes bacterium]|nr:MAG: cell division protein ZapA [Bacteroidota bacterium]
MTKKSISIVVAGRSYPLSVNESEEQKIKQAAEDINKSIKLLQENYAVKDMQDLLAMTALQLASKSGTSGSTANTTDFSGVESALDTLLKEIDDME